MSKSKSGGLTFLKPAGGSEDSKTVSARVPMSVYTSFQNAVDVAQKAGMSLSITDVVIEAMRAAVKEVKSHCGEDAFQRTLPLPSSSTEKTDAIKPATQPAPQNTAGITKPNTPSSPVGKAPEPVKK